MAVIDRKAEAVLKEKGLGIIELSADESLTSLAMYFRNWHMFHEYMNNIAC